MSLLCCNHPPDATPINIFQEYLELCFLCSVSIKKKLHETVTTLEHGTGGNRNLVVWDMITQIWLQNRQSHSLGSETRGFCIILLNLVAVNRTA